ncbi:rod shape-determining protein MreC [Parapedomonas caeni]
MPLPPATTPPYPRARWRWLIGRGMVIFLVLLGSLMLIANRSIPPAMMSGVALDGIAPALSVLRAPVEWVRQGVTEVQRYFFVHRRNAELEKRLRRAQAIESRYRTVVAENARLKQLLRIVEPGQQTVGTARIVGSTAGSYVRSAIVLLGAREGVARGQPVRDADGLVGQVVDVGQVSARVLLLTDLASRVPVRVEGTSRTAIATGLNEPELLLEFLSPGRPLRQGDRLVTSGDGGTFPPGIPVALVTTPQGAEPRARPLANPGGLDFVVILRPFVPEALQPPAPSPGLAPALPAAPAQDGSTAP